MYANPRNWWQLYLRGYPLIRTYSLFENDFKDMIKELLNSKDVDNELVDKEANPLNKIKKQINNFTEADLKTLEELIRKKLNKDG